MCACVRVCACVCVCHPARVVGSGGWVIYIGATQLPGSKKNTNHKPSISIYIRCIYTPWCKRMKKTLLLVATSEVSNVHFMKGAAVSNARTSSDATTIYKILIFEEEF